MEIVQPSQRGTLTFYRRRKEMQAGITDYIKRKLRGRHNSLKYKYITLPIDYTIEIFFRLTGRKWIDFYRLRMNRETTAGKKNNEKISEKYIDDAKFQRDFLIENGLKRGHSLLDYGCGVMRLRVHLEGEEINYFGVDISNNRLMRGLEMLKSRGINIDSTHAVFVSDYELSSLEKRKFDFIWAQSVYTHIPLDEIEISMRHLKSRLESKGKFIFTFSPASGSQIVRLNQKDWWQPPSVIEACARRAGFEVEIVPEWNGAAGGMAAILTLPRQPAPQI